jgi:excisionase family DNA binding protein
MRNKSEPNKFESSDAHAQVGSTNTTKLPCAVLLTVVEAAGFLHISVGTLCHFVSQRRVPVVRISSRCIRFSRLDLEEWVASHSQPSRDSGTVARAVAEKEVAEPNKSARGPQERSVTGCANGHNLGVSM